jgi:hypothetical protein
MDARGKINQALQCLLDVHEPWSCTRVDEVHDLRTGKRVFRATVTGADTAEVEAANAHDLIDAAIFAVKTLERDREVAQEWADHFGLDDPRKLTAAQLRQMLEV